MRDFLTYVGIGLILVLTALLGAPYAIDFNAHRARFAEEISRATGAQAKLDGRIEFGMLPTPYFSAENISLQGEQGTFKAAKATFELSLPALLQGTLDFTRAEFSHFSLDLDGDRLRRPHAAARFDDLALRDGRVRVFHAGAAFLALDKVDIAAKIPSLDGPFDARGAFSLHERRIGYSLGADMFKGDRLPLKIVFTGPADLGRLALDGALDLAGALRFVGKGLAGRAAPEPATAAGVESWRAEGDIVAQPESVKLDKATLLLGEGAQAAKFTGSAAYGLAAGAVSVTLASPRVEGPWAERIAGAIAGAMERAAPTALRLRIDRADWRGVWARVALARDPGGPLTLSAEGAGGARIAATAAPDAAKVWRGKAELSAADYQAFAEATGARALPFHKVAASGAFSLAAGALAVTDGRFALDRASFSGDFAWMPERRGARARLAAKLAATGLDPETAPDYFAALGGDADLDLALDAQTVGKGEGRLSLRLTRDRGLSRLAKLDAKNLEGADVSASGEWKAGFAALKGEAQVKARNLEDFARLLARLAPSQAAQTIAARARLLSPASLNARADAGGYAFDGQAAATRFSARLDENGAIALDVAAPEAFDLLGQLGAPQLLGPQKLGPGQITLQTQNQGGQRQVTGKASLGKIGGGFTGTFRDGALDGVISLSGDPSSLIGGPAGVGKITGQMQARAGLVRLRQIVGERDGARFSGDLAISEDGVSGDLDVDRVSAPAFLALTLGAPAPVRKGAVWSSLSFAPVLIDPPHAQLRIRAGEVAPFGTPARFELTLGPNMLKVSGIDAALAGGRLRGGFDLRRRAGQATLSGEMSGEGLVLKNPAVSATVGGKIKFAGSGGSMAALVGSLSGTGSGAIAGLAVAGAAPEAPQQTLAAQAASEAPFSARQTVRDLDQALLQGDLKVGDGEATLRLSQGVAKVVRDPVAFTYDLTHLTFALAAALPDGQAEVSWTGPWSAPSRKIDAGGFVTLAASSALEREQARIARQREADRQRKAEVLRQKKEELERRRQAERERRLELPPAEPQAAPKPHSQAAPKPDAPAAPKPDALAAPKPDALAAPKPDVLAAPVR
jgi:hypothetical protein